MTTLSDTLSTLDQEATPGPWYVIRRGGAFFRPNAQGYTTHIVAAGTYSRVEADKYADVEGVTIHPLDAYRAEAMRTIEEAQRILSALGAASHLEAGWQPIEQAPKDGTLLDLWVVYTADDGWSAGERVTECRWRNESATYYEGWQNSFGNLIEWSQKDERTGAEYGRKVTHFRLLPAPPSIPHPPAGESDRG